MFWALIVGMTPVISGCLPELDRDKSGTRPVEKWVKMQKPWENQGVSAHQNGGAERGILCRWPDVVPNHGNMP